MLSALFFTQACSTSDGVEDVARSDASVVTDIVPTSDYCNSGLKGGECVSAPPANPTALQRLKVDGDFDGLEYAHAITLPYTDLQLKASGSVFLQAVHGSSLFGRSADGLLHLYFENIPFRASDVDAMSEWTLEVYVDGARFNGKTMCFDSADRRYEFNFGTHSFTTFQPRGAAQSCDLITYGWRTANDSRVQFAVKGCAPDASTPQVVRCSAEARIPIRYSDMEVAPTDGLKLLTPGVGFGVTSRRGYGASPEYLSDDLFNYPNDAHTDRTLFPTLLFGPPKGPHSFPLRIMTFNVRRFASPGLKGHHLLQWKPGTSGISWRRSTWWRFRRDGMMSRSKPSSSTPTFNEQLWASRRSISMAPSISTPHCRRQSNKRWVLGRYARGQRFNRVHRRKASAKRAALTVGSGCSRHCSSRWPGAKSTTSARVRTASGPRVCNGSACS